MGTVIAMKTFDRRGNKTLFLCGLLAIFGASGCVSFGSFKPYVSKRRPAAQKKKQAVRVNVWRARSKFTPYEDTVPIAKYIKDGLSIEFQNAGFVVDERVPKALVVNAVVNQYDIGYETYWWNTIIFIFGYSSVETFTVADLTVEVTIPATGNRYRRRFFAANNDKSRQLWIGPFLPILPIPVSGFTNEEKQILDVSQKCFGQIAAAVEALLQREVGTAALKGWRRVASRERGLR